MSKLINRLQEILNVTTDAKTAQELQEVVNEMLNNSSQVLDTKTKLLAVNGNQLKLTRQEFKMLESLILANGVLNRQELLEKAWPNTYVGPRTVDVHVRKLRQKLGDNSIVTHAGMGYQLMTDIILK